MSIADRGAPEVVIPEGALDYRNLFRLHLAEIEVMKTTSIRASLNYSDVNEIHLRRFDRAVHLLFVEAVIQGKYNELVVAFTKRMLLK